MNNRELKVGLAQISPVWLDQKKTAQKICHYIDQAGKEACDLIVFGEALLPGYPFWLSFTDGAVFESKVQKEIHAYYMSQSIQVDSETMLNICRKAKENKIAIYLGTIERPKDRSHHSLYCSLIYINKEGEIVSVHRKLQPTYEERLSWSPGDGHGLTVHAMGDFNLGGLNCWENWMPLSRTALYGQGENVHVAVWPGCVRNTIDITRFIAVESRSYSIGVCSLLHKDEIPKDIPHYDFIYQNAPEWMADGGTCIAMPDGKWLVEPLAKKETLITEVLEIEKIYEERQNFDASGHYSRPDVTQLIVNKERQTLVNIKK